MKNVTTIALLLLMAGSAAARAGLAEDAALQKFFAQPGVDCADPASLEEALGVTMGPEEYRAACEAAKPVRPGLLATAPGRFDAFQTKLGGLSSAPKFDGQKDAGVEVSVMGGGGRSPLVGGVGQIGLLTRIPVAPIKGGRHGNVGLSVGVKGTWGGGGSRVISDTHPDRGPNGEPTYGEYQEVISEHWSGLATQEFLRVGYQTPRVGRFVLETGVGLGRFSYDPRVSTFRTVTDHEEVSDWCVNEYGDSYECWKPHTSTVLSEKLGVGPGDKQVGVMNTVYAAASVALSPRWSTRVEVSRFTAWALHTGGTTFDAGLTYVFSKKPTKI